MKSLAHQVCIIIGSNPTGYAIFFLSLFLSLLPGMTDTGQFLLAFSIGYILGCSL